MWIVLSFRVEGVLCDTQRYLFVGYIRSRVSVNTIRSIAGVEKLSTEVVHGTVAGVPLG